MEALIAGPLPIILSVVAVVVILGIIGGLLYTVREQVQQCLVGCIDCMAVVGVGCRANIISCWHGFECFVYPIKEGIISTIDAQDKERNPYKQKVPYSHVPQFSY